VVSLLVVGRCGELDHADVPGVELRDEALDRAALAGGILTLEGHADRRAELPAPDQPAEGEAQLGEARPGFVEPVRLLLAGELLGQVEVVEDAHES
jgi:hypothetical protein